MAMLNYQMVLLLCMALLKTSAFFMVPVRSTYRNPHYNHQALLWVKTLVHWYSKSFIGLQIELNQCSTPQKI